VIRGLLALIGWVLLVSANTPLPVAQAVITGETLPRNLSDFRFFTDGIDQTPNAGVVGYDLNTPLFTDYAAKQRFVYVPPGETARYTADGVFEFPVGSARREDGWVALPYVWNEDGSDALLRRAGRRIPVSFVDGAGTEQVISYRVPNQNQCKNCHLRDDAIALIGPSARNLNDGVQLTQWHTLGILDRIPDTMLRIPRWDDPDDGTLDERARAYLDVNCAHCHRRDGSASNSGLFLRYEEADPIARGIFKRPVAAGRGSGGLDFDIEPGHPERSIVLFRMQASDPGIAMPELGREILHREGIELIRRYIVAMDAEN
jgi:hypothetical protein